jgi:hypothetical protein
MKQCSSGSLAGIMVSIGSSAGSGSGVMMCFVSSIGSIIDSGINVCVGSLSERNAYFGDSFGSVSGGILSLVCSSMCLKFSWFSTSLGTENRA